MLQQAGRGSSAAGRNYGMDNRNKPSIDNRKPDLNSRKGDSSVWKQRLDEAERPRAKEDTLTSLLMKARILSQTDICEAMEIAESHGQPVDQVLTTSGILSEDLRQLCVKAVNYIERGLVSETLAIDGLQVAYRKKLTFEGGLSYFGWGW
jgi:hypothetical protein